MISYVKMEQVYEIKRETTWKEVVLYQLLIDIDRTTRIQLRNNNNNDDNGINNEKE